MYETIQGTKNTKKRVKLTYETRKEKCRKQNKKDKCKRERGEKREETRNESSTLKK